MSQSIAQPVRVSTTPHVLRMLQGRSALANSTRVWLLLVVFLGLVNLFITFVDAGLKTDARSALFSWPAIAIFGVAGLASK